MSTVNLPVDLVYLNVALPMSTSNGNPLLYVTDLKTAPVSCCHDYCSVHTDGLLHTHVFQARLFVSCPLLPKLIQSCLFAYYIMWRYPLQNSEEVQERQNVSLNVKWFTSQHDCRRAGFLIDDGAFHTTKIVYNISPLLLATSTYCEQLCVVGSCLLAEQS